MSAIPVIAIFDIGKTNKKLFLFDEDYRIVYEKTARFNETADEDGFECENLDALRRSLFDSLHEVMKMDKFDVKAVNFSAYGASFVYVDESGEPLTPLYNYLKAYPEDLEEIFYEKYGPKEDFARETASPALGNLNSGLQLYRFKHEQPEKFAKTKYALHLPQYMSYLVSREAVSDMTSIGCHTALWNFDKNQYHDWVVNEGIAEKLPPVVAADDAVEINYEGKKIAVGRGLHDSSAALIPYLVNFHEPFMLLSTGTWCISLNQFNNEPLTADELSSDCLCYINYHDKPVKASRLFSGYEHEKQTRRIAIFFDKPISQFRTMEYNSSIICNLKQNPSFVRNGELISFKETKLREYKNEEEAYHHLIYTLVQQQVISSGLILKGTPVKRIFVDGGFGKNVVFMNMLAAAFENVEVFAASMPQATSLGAAIALHKLWNHKALPASLIELKFYVSMDVCGESN